MKKTLLLHLLFLSSALNSVSSYADIHSEIRFDLSTSYEDNVNRSPFSRNAIEDSFASVNIDYSLNQKLGDNFISYHLGIKYDGYKDIEGLNNAEIKTGVRFHFKPNPGFSSALYILKADISVADFKTDLRDRSAVDIAALSAFWLTDSLSFRGGLSYRARDSDSRVFDNTESRLFISADLVLSKRATLYASLNYSKGDLVSSLPDPNAAGLDNNNGELSDLLNVISQLALDGTDAETDPTFGADIVSYTIDTNIASLTLGYNLIIRRKQSLDFAVQYALGNADFGIEYQATYFNISYLTSFEL